MEWTSALGAIAVGATAICIEYRQILFRKKPLGELAARIVTSLRESPEDWVMKHECTPHHKPTGLEIWHHLGSNNTHIHNPETVRCFARHERGAIWNAVETWKKSADQAQIHPGMQRALSMLREHQR